MRENQFFVAALVVGSALVFDPGGWFAFGPVKWVVITVLGVASAAVALYQGTALHRLSTTAWGVFLIWAAITSLTALDSGAAWLGTPDRRFGFVALLTLACAYVGGQAVGTSGTRTVVARSVVVALLGMAAYGLLEVAGLEPVRLTTTTERLGATYGSAAYLGAALALFLPVAVGAAASESRRPWRWAAVASLVGGVGLLAGTGTRAALVGLLAAAVLSSPQWARSIRPVLAVAGGVVLVAVLAVSPLGRRTVTQPLDGRLAEWRIGASALVADPWDGVGLEGYRVVFPSHVDVPYVQDYGRSTVTDRAHSGPLDTGIALGLPGMVGWLTALAFFANRAWRAVRQTDPLVTGIGAGVVALFVQELLLFPTIEVGAAGWALAGVLVAADSSTAPVRSRVGATGLGLVAALALVVGALDVAADHRAAAARIASDVVTADRAAQLRPDSFRYPLLAAQIAAENGDLVASLPRVQKARSLSSLDPALRLAHARTVTAMAAEGSIGPVEALQAVEPAVAADRHHPDLRMLQGELLAAADRPAQAERAWLAAAHLRPDDPAPRRALAALYANLGETELAQEQAARADEIQSDRDGDDKS